MDMHRRPTPNRRRVNRSSWCRGIAVAALVGASLVLSPAAAASSDSLATGVIPLKVTFAGTGTMTVDESYVYPAEACFIDSQDTFDLNWVAEFKAVVDQGRVSFPNPLGVLRKGPGSFTIQTQITPGAPELEVPCEQEVVPACSGPLPTGPQPGIDFTFGYNLSDELQRRIGVEVQSATQSPVVTNCSGPVAVEAKNDIEVLEQALPGAMTGRAVLPPKALYDGSETVAVSSADAPEQVAGECSAGERINEYISNTGCSATMEWSGTVTFKAVCGAKNGSVDCIKEQVKKWAAHLAQVFHEKGVGALNPPWYEILVPESQRTVSAVAKKHMAATAFFLMASSEREIADDPPSSAYAHVAKPRLPHPPDAAAIRRSAPATYRLLRGYLQAGAVLQALATSQNRASGAYLALARGNKAAAGALAKQDRAVLAYAKQAARLLKGQHGKALAAAAELRRIAFGLRGTAVRRAPSLLRFATGLVSQRSLAADKLAARALGRIRG